MGRWTQYDEDDYRLPEGFKRVAYDADTGQYTYQDTRGNEWNGAPYQTHGTLRPAEESSPGPTRIYQVANATKDTGGRRLSSNSLDGPWTSITKEMAESGLTPEELSSNPMYPRRRSSSRFVETAKNMAKRTLRSFSVSAVNGTEKDESDEIEKPILRRRPTGTGTSTTKPPRKEKTAGLKHSFSTPAPTPQKDPRVGRSSTVKELTPTPRATALRPSKTISHSHSKPAPALTSEHNKSISRTLAYAYDLPPIPPVVPPKEQRPSVTRTSHHHRSVTSPMSPTTQHHRSQSHSHSHSRSQSQSHHSKSGSAVPAADAGKPSHRGERVREHGSGSTGRRGEKEKEGRGTRWKDQKEREREEREKGTTRNESDRKASSSSPSRPAEKTPIYSQFNTVKNRK
ncbi:hypothetical protein BT96DRAFT_924468 [Gymnopus androsaceus JB14]|uniref:Uncharacterized protein n=1 Tax=Gymnopus androsaceus JB14 TaxID=1447944 RepID=A0A6A4H6I3_9AGAR|nr:hypothetical protein BT96DRAFT_924468 [Gymnopus androsaceus JB14]